MKKKSDSEAYQRLWGALEAARLHEAELRLRRERKHWRELDPAASYAELLAGLSTDELAAIQRNLDWQGRSGLKKAERIAELVFVLVERCAKLFDLFDRDQYQLVRRVIAAGGYTGQFDLQPEQLEYFRERGLLFSGTLGGERVLRIPDELAALFAQHDDVAYQRRVRRNSAWIRRSQGLLYYYGTVSFARLAKILAEAEALPALDRMEMIAVLTSAADYYQVMRRVDFGMAHRRALDWRKIEAEQAARPELPFYGAEPAAWDRAGEPGFYEKSPALQELVRFLASHFHIARDVAAKTVVEWEYAIKNGVSPEVLLGLAQQRFSLADRELLGQCSGLLDAFYGATRQWFLKGHSLAELAVVERAGADPAETGGTAAPSRVASPGAERPAGFAPGNYLFKVALAASLWRQIKLAAGHTLLDLHRAIQEAYGFDDEHRYAFFMDGQPYSRQRYEAPGEGRGPFVDQARLGELGLAVGQQFLYLFDFGDEWRFRVTLEAILPDEPLVLRPELVRGKGRSPEQYPDYS
jgi:hypothetical protein